MTTERDYDLRRHEGLGKFSGGLVIDEYVWAMSLDGGCDDDFSHDGFGYWGLMQGPLIEGMALRQTGIKPTDDEWDFLKACVGCIVHENDSGFVTVTYFDDAEKMNKAWEETVAEFTEEDGLDDDLKEHEEWPE